jgi:hypothetical protein
MKLCILSVAEFDEYEFATVDRGDCPAGLTKSQARACPCKRREHVGRPVAEDGFVGDDWQDCTVVSCTFPVAFNGQQIVDLAAFREAVSRNARRRR